MSRSSRARGLKHFVYSVMCQGFNVALFTGAWIETFMLWWLFPFISSVALFTGAWIETRLTLRTK